MQLDSSRNHIILVNLWLSMISISVMAMTILPAWFGMNLHSGLPEESTHHFYMVGLCRTKCKGRGWVCTGVLACVCGPPQHPPQPHPCTHPNPNARSSPRAC